MSSEYCVHSIDGPVEICVRRIPTSSDGLGDPFYLLEISGESKEPGIPYQHRYSVKLFGGAEPPVINFEDVSESVAQGAGEVG